jgi:hypothetical protein
MSTLVTQNITDGNNSVSVETLKQGSAKAWGYILGTTGGIFDSYNISSVTDYNTGYYDINFTNPMSNTNYVVNCQEGRPSVSVNLTNVTEEIANKSINSCRLYVNYIVQTGTTPAAWSGAPGIYVLIYSSI